MTKDEEIAKLKQSLAMAKQKKTLRDELAMAALTAAVEKYGLGRIDDIACAAYWVADAMMQERHK